VKGKMAMPVLITAPGTVFNMHSQKDGMNDVFVTYDISFWPHLTLSNPIFLPHANSPALNYFGWERGWWVTCNYPTILKEKNGNRKSITCAICWLKSVQENHNVELRHYDFPVPDTFPHVVRTLANRWCRLYSFCLQVTHQPLSYPK
jgi:hypothetical protein